MYWTENAMRTLWFCVLSTKWLTCLCSKRENTFASQTIWLSYEIRRFVDMPCVNVYMSVCTRCMYVSVHDLYVFHSVLILFAPVRHSVLWFGTQHTFDCIFSSSLIFPYSIVFRSVSFVTDFFFLLPFFSHLLCPSFCDSVINNNFLFLFRKIK